MNTEGPSHTLELGSAPVAPQSPPASHGTGPLVSVILPTYNCGHLIGETFECLRSQTYSHWECVVVDDGSTDDTGELVARFAQREPRLRYVWQENQRQATARNTGLADARGEYVQFLDADDLIESRKLERQITYLEEHPEVDIVYGGVRYFRTPDTNERLYSMGTDNVPWMPCVSGAGREVLKALVWDNIMVINSPLIRRSIVHEVGSFDVGLTPAEDWDYWLRCALAGAYFQFADIEETLSLVRIHAPSSSQDRFGMHRAGLLIRKKLAALIEDEQILDLNRELRARNEQNFGIMEAARGNAFRGAWHLLNSAWFERRSRWKTKLFLCALMTPFVSETRLRSLLVSSMTGSPKNVEQKGKAS